MGQFHQHFEANHKGRDFVVGDIHAMVIEFKAALEKNNFDPAIDRVFSVGDIIDRGPSSESAIALLDEPWFFSVMGNHEEKMLDVADGEQPDNWFRYGGRWAKTHMDQGSFQTYVDKIKDLPIAITIDTKDGKRVGITHAEPGVEVWSLEDDVWGLPTVRQIALWGRTILRNGIAAKTEGVDITIHGHTPIDEGKRLGNAVFIDTGCVYGKYLTLMTLDDVFSLPCSALKKN